MTRSTENPRDRAERVILRWRTAYMAANNKTPPPLSYKAGWIRSASGLRWRVSTIEAMAEKLEKRAGIGGDA